MILLLSVFPLLLLSDGVKHSDMRKVYVDLLCGGFTMLCAFFVYHDLGYKGTDDLGCERFDIDEFFSREIRNAPRCLQTLSNARSLFQVRVAFRLSLVAQRCSLQIIGGTARW